MENKVEVLNSFLEREYPKKSQILKNGELFTVVHREEINVAHAIENLERMADNQQKQQTEVIKRKYQVKIASLENLQNKLKMALKNPSMLNSDDLARIKSMLEEMQILLDSLKNHEINDSNKVAEDHKKKSVEEYRKRSQLILDKHLKDAQKQLDSIMSSFEPLESFYETASLDSPIWANLKNKNTFPVINRIRLGEDVIKVVSPLNQSITYSMPEVVPFFNRKSLTIVYKNEERDKLKNLLDNILTRCLMSAEAGNILFHFMDGNGNGSLFFDYLKCGNKTLQLFDGKINISPQEIEACLQKLQLTYKEIDQKIRKGESITQYNERNPKATLPYHIVVMDSFPNGMSSSYIPFVMRLMRDELAAGLHFIFLVEKQDLSKVTNLIDLTSVYRLNDNYVMQDGMSDMLMKVLSFVDKNYTTEKSMLFEEYYNNNVIWWKDSCSNFTCIPLGLNYANNYNLLFNEEGKKNGVASASAVIAGMPGCGKSSLLNTMIVGASIVYSPNELHFIMIDMKGVGFKQYATEKLPHAEYIALKAKPTYGLHILRNVRKMGEERQKLLVEKNVKNYDAFRKKFPSEILPRYMIFIDEYQELLRDDTRAEALDIIEYIVRVLRYSGFNLILSSQSMDLSNRITDNISHKIVMRCSTAVARDVLGNFDERAPMLNTGQAIISCAGTDVVQSYYLPGDDNDIPAGGSMSCKSFLTLIREKWKAETDGNYEHNLAVFETDTPAFLSNNKVYLSMSYNKQMVKKELLFSPGEKYLVDGKDVFFKLNRSKNENILIVGGYGSKLDVSIRAANTTFMSMLPQLDLDSTLIDIVSYQDKSVIELYDAIHNSSKDVCRRFAKASFLEQPDSIDALLNDIVKDIEDRKGKVAKGIIDQPRLLIIYKTDANNQFMMVEEEDEYYNKKLVTSEQTRMLLKILEEGPIVGVFSLLHFAYTDGYKKVFFESDDDNKLEYFCHRILLQMSQDDSPKFLNSIINNEASQLVDNDAGEEYKYNMALYKNIYDNSESVILKPYEFLI